MGQDKEEKEEESEEVKEDTNLVEVGRSDELVGSTNDVVERPPSS